MIEMSSKGESGKARAWHDDDDDDYDDGDGDDGGGDDDDDDDDEALLTEGTKSGSKYQKIWISAFFTNDEIEWN